MINYGVYYMVKYIKIFDPLAIALGFKISSGFPKNLLVGNLARYYNM